MFVGRIKVWLHSFCFDSGVLFQYSLKRFCFDSGVLFQYSLKRFCFDSGVLFQYSLKRFCFDSDFRMSRIISLSFFPLLFIFFSCAVHSTLLEHPTVSDKPIIWAFFSPPELPRSPC
jgi:hypothetical protein